MIPTAPFGKTGHDSTRVIFGAAALGFMTQDKADQTLDALLEFGINHLDTAASYGESELRIGPWMAEHRKRFFLATKTGDRTAEAARASLHRSLDRLRVDHVDMIQLHNIVQEDEWEVAMGPGGALEALIEAREQGLTRFIGVTGHGTQVARMHRRSLERYAFDAVLFPYNFTMLAQPDYAADVEKLRAACRERGVAQQTIKSVARRRWSEVPEKFYSWYEPVRDAEAIHRAVNFVLAEPDLFLNTSSDATLLRTALEAASKPIEAPEPALMAADVDAFGIEPLFVPGRDDTY